MDVGSEAERNAQLVVEVEVRDLARSLAFYEAIGFVVERRATGFAALRWESHYLFLAEHARDAGGTLPVNLRVIVPDADAVWSRVVASGATVLRPIADRSYGLRDFTIVDPDGFGIRFAQPLGAT